MSAESWWMQPTVTRAGFAATCCSRFGFGFDSGYVANWTPPQEPIGRKKGKAAYPSVLDSINVQGKSRGKGHRWNTNQSQRMVSKQRLVG